MLRLNYENTKQRNEKKIRDENYAYTYVEHAPINLKWVQITELKKTVVKHRVF